METNTTNLIAEFTRPHVYISQVHEIHEPALLILFENGYINIPMLLLLYKEI
jgi:hypothetical protein